MIKSGERFCGDKEFPEISENFKERINYFWFINIPQILVKCQFSPKLSFSFMVLCLIQRPNYLIIEPGEPTSHKRMQTYATPMW